MPDRRRLRTVPDGRPAGPRVTVQGGPSPDLGPRRTAGRRLARWGLAVLLLGYTGVALRDSSQRDAATREATGIRLTLTGSGAVPRQVGAPGEPVQTAVVALAVRNTGTVALRLVEDTLDGTRRRLDLSLRPGQAGDVPVAWQVRCAEVGTLPGPRVLLVAVHGPARRHAVRLDVPEQDAGSGLEPIFHRAATQVCDVLVTRPG